MKSLGRNYVDIRRVELNRTVTATLAEINAGKELLPAIAGVQYEITSLHVLVTGAFATLTDVRISTSETVPTDILTILQAQLGDGVKHSHLTGTNTLGSAFWAALAANYGVQIRKTGSTGTVGTSITVRIGYKIVKPD